VSGAIFADEMQAISTQQLHFAGQSILLVTNSSDIARYARDFLPEAAMLSTPPRARLTLFVKETDDAISQPSPWFRARGHFAIARFSNADAFWFNLRTGEVYGVVSPSFVGDRRRWHVHVFPALLGILSAVIDVAPIHAACLARNRRGILLAGHSGAGKSTLAIALARRGYALLSDDWTYLSSDDTSGTSSHTEAWGLPVPVKLLPATANFFTELLACDLEVSLNGEIAYEVYPEECFGVTRISRCPVAAIALLERAEAPGCRVLSISAEEAIDHLISEVEPLDGTLAPYYDQQVDLIRRLESASCYRVIFNDHPDNVAENLDSLLSSVS
jgi:hypothetical protein